MTNLTADEAKYLIFKNRKRATLNAKMLNDEDSAYVIANLNMYMIQGMTQKGFINLTKYYKPFIKGLTISKMKAIKRILQAVTIRRLDEYTLYKGRLYPLPKKEYIDFARMVYERRGAPVFGKQIITGVVFGLPETVSRGFGITKVILSRTVGCYIKSQMVNSEIHCKIALAIED